MRSLARDVKQLSARLKHSKLKQEKVSDSSATLFGISVGTGLALGLTAAAIINRLAS